MNDAENTGPLYHLVAKTLNFRPDLGSKLAALLGVMFEENFQAAIIHIFGRRFKPSFPGMAYLV
jgi:hypothetical protein